MKQLSRCRLRGNKSSLEAQYAMLRRSLPPGRIGTRCRWSSSSKLYLSYLRKTISVQQHAGIVWGLPRRNDMTRRTRAVTLTTIFLTESCMCVVFIRRTRCCLSVIVGWGRCRLFVNREPRWRRINKWWWKGKVHSEDQSSQVLSEVREWIFSAKTQQTGWFSYF